MREDLPVGEGFSDNDGEKSGEWRQHTTTAIATDSDRYSIFVVHIGCVSGKIESDARNGMR